METFFYIVYNSTLFSFKSYYVVWKQNTAVEGEYISLRLNRTMQYGNYTADDTPGNDLKRLNRTMQYGNVPTNIKRTMQIARFKSYYVVWKLEPLFLGTE